MFNPSTGRYEQGWRPRQPIDNPFEDAEGLPIDPGLIEGEGGWKDVINTKTGEHSVKTHELKVVKQWCHPELHFFKETDATKHTIECEQCGMESHYVLGMHKLVNGKLIRIAPQG